MTFELNIPIAGDAPFGIYLKDDKATYRTLRNAFNAAQAGDKMISVAYLIVLGGNVATEQAAQKAEHNRSTLFSRP